MATTIDNIIVYLQVKAVQDQGKNVVKTVKDFQALAMEARSETAKLLGNVQKVIDKLTKVQWLFAAAFFKIAYCDATPPCSNTRVSQLHLLSFSQFREKKNMWPVLYSFDVCSFIIRYLSLTD